MNFEGKRLTLIKSSETDSSSGHTLDREPSRFKVEEGSDIGYGSVLRKVDFDSEEVSANDEYESEFVQVPGSNIGYGSALVRKGKSIKDKVKTVKDYERLSEVEILSRKERSDWLNEKQRKLLRSVLFSLGVTLMPMKDSSDKDLDREQVNDPVSAGHLFVSENPENTKPPESEKLEPVEPDAFDLIVGEHSKNIKPEDLALTLEFSDKPVLGNEEYGRLQYAQEKVEFRSMPDESRERPAVPEFLQKKLIEVMPGWIAQESRFKGDAVSSTGAVGLFQLKKSVWKEYKDSDEVSLRLDEQLPVFGELTSDNYHYILFFAGEDSISILRSRFNSEEKFLEELMLPLILNAYNAGGPTVGKVLKKFVDEVPVEDMKLGKELFLQFVDFAGKNGFTLEQVEYTARVLAFNEKFGDGSG